MGIFGYNNFSEYLESQSSLYKDAEPCNENKKEYIKPEVLAASKALNVSCGKSVPGGRPCNPPKPGGR